ncbi:MAG: hypothetical protein RLY30_1201 [Pseudomonadota bacterium]|jgi:hypothetical protein
MDTVLLFFIFTLLGIVVVLMLVLVDHVRALQSAVGKAGEPGASPESEASGGDPSSPGAAEAGAEALSLVPDAPPANPADTPDPAFGSLVGKRLWDGMTGKPVDGVEADQVAALRQRFEPVLIQHITELFMEGQGHAAQGGSKPPSNRRKVVTLDGYVPSWIPQQHADSIYQAGFDSFAVNEKSIEALRKSFAEVVDLLCSRTEIKTSGESLARRLVSLPQDRLAALPSPDTAALPAPEVLEQQAA